ncbi:MAG: tetratricopeptide repeat protein [Bryobacterales bacterium]|nr:tetratricopeptide repeat protein [Bryobacterales bacterium]MBV9398075.1 tetratricopeptide repeat protein [Bryobacterales bacterium]
MKTRWLIALVLANAAYIAALPAANLFYIGNVLLHLALGTAGAIVLCWQWRRSPKIVLLIAGAVLGGLLMVKGATHDHFPALWAHITLAAAGVAILLPSNRWRVAIAALGLTSIALRFGWPAERIRNSQTVAESMAGEGAGTQSPFWPSAATTNTGGLIPSDFFMESAVCGECHRDIYQQWKSSMHHFASFNNRFYGRSIEHMQELSGTQGSKWCAGCHDHAVFFNGRFDRPIKEQVDTPEAQNGLGCVSCHSIAHVNGSVGNGGFTIVYPPLHRLASTQNPWIRRVDRFVTYLNPEPHRRTFLKPFMREDSAEFCSACHKVHLDEPVNHYRWFRGFNEYDNWQASGVSGEGARSFYYPAQSATCGSCHMPMVASQDPGNRGGMVHSHRFAAANTAVASVNRDDVQLKATKDFLQSGFITVDLFAASEAGTNKGDMEMLRRASDTPTLASTFAVGEEAESPAPAVIREVGRIAAPLDAPAVRFAPGSTVRVDAVVRTRKIGHFFPAGTVDVFDVWLEFKATDANGRVLAWSGRVEDNGRGPVEKGAHFYRSFQLDAEGNPIDKRNAWQTRSVLYVRLIPPGAADTVHFRLPIPADVHGPVTLQARLNYRKFSEYYTKYAYAGVAKSGRAGIGFDSREYAFDSAPVPELPIVTLASSTVNVAVGPAPVWQSIPRRQDRERWNDWGIGLLLQGDLKGAEYAFRRVTEIEPEYPDGWVNVARALIQEGETAAARGFIDRALKLSPTLARAHFFLASIQKTDGDYGAALRSLDKVRVQYPRDRVVLNQIGRILFLERRYADAVRVLEQAVAVDPEDVQAHYDLMLSYRGLGQTEKAAHEEALFRRFKADETSQQLTARVRQLSPEDNNERQPIHDHVPEASLSKRPLPRQTGSSALDEPFR